MLDGSAADLEDQVSHFAFSFAICGAYIVGLSGGISASTGSGAGGLTKEEVTLR